MTKMTWRMPKVPRPPAAEHNGANEDNWETWGGCVHVWVVDPEDHGLVEVEHNLLRRDEAAFVGWVLLFFARHGRLPKREECTEQGGE